VAEGVRRVSVGNQTEQLAWVVLRATDRTQSRGSSDRLVVPRAPEVADEIGTQLTDIQFSSVEEYLEAQGYITPGNLKHTWGAYTAYSITPAGLEWLEGGPSDEETAFESAARTELEEERRGMGEIERALAEESPGTPEHAVEVQEGTGPRSSAGGAQEGAERPWWRRVFSI
jgi:hypothetical protein